MTTPCLTTDRYSRTNAPKQAGKATGGQTTTNNGASRAMAMGLPAAARLPKEEQQAAGLPAASQPVSQQPAASAICAMSPCAACRYCPSA